LIQMSNVLLVMEYIKGHRERFPKLVKMSVLFIKINFSQRYILIFSRNKVSGFETCFASISHRQISHSFNRESSENL